MVDFVQVAATMIPMGTGLTIRKRPTRRITIRTTRGELRGRLRLGPESKKAENSLGGITRWASGTLFLGHPNITKYYLKWKNGRKDKESIKLSGFIMIYGFKLFRQHKIDHINISISFKCNLLINFHFLQYTILLSACYFLQCEFTSTRRSITAQNIIFENSRQGRFLGPWKPIDLLQEKNFLFL